MPLKWSHAWLLDALIKDGIICISLFLVLADQQSATIRMRIRSYLRKRTVQGNLLCVFQSWRGGKVVHCCLCGSQFLLFSIEGFYVNRALVAQGSDCSWHAVLKHANMLRLCSTYCRLNLCNLMCLVRQWECVAMHSWLPRCPTLNGSYACSVPLGFDQTPASSSFSHPFSLTLSFHIVRLCHWFPFVLACFGFEVSGFKV